MSTTPESSVIRLLVGSFEYLCFEKDDDFRREIALALYLTIWNATRPVLVIYDIEVEWMQIQACVSVERVTYGRLH